jgi:histidinol dehydrogenase
MSNPLAATRLVAAVLIDRVEQQLEAALSDFGETFAEIERADITALLQALRIVLEQGDRQEIQLIQQGLQSAIATFHQQVEQRLREEENFWQDLWGLGLD